MDARRMSSQQSVQQPQTAESWIEHQLGSICSLTQQYVNQLLHGCGCEDCTSPICFTGRCNTSTNPVRKPTPRSARAVALSLLFSEHPGKNLCLKGKDSVTISSSDDKEFPKDNHNLLQHIADAHIIKRVVANEPDIGFKISDEVLKASYLASRHLSALRLVQAPPYTTKGEENAQFYNNADAVDPIVASIELVCDLSAFRTLKNAPDDTIRRLLIALESFLTDHANQKPWRPSSTTPFDETTRLYDLIDELSHHPYAVLTQAIFETIARRTLLADVSSKLMLRQSAETSFLQRLVSRLGLARDKDFRQSHKWRLLNIWSLNTWTRMWNGNPVLHRGRAACGVLELADLLQRSAGSASLPQLYFSHSELGAEELMQSYIKHEHVSHTESLHLLSFVNLLDEGLAARLCRSLSFLVMRRSQVKAVVTSAFYQQNLGRGRRLSSDMLDMYRNLSATFLVLKIRRSHALEDAFDQLWHRERLEFHKPLRVLFEESDGVAMGQDFGGVQVEFFNVLFKHALQEETGLFTTSTSSGLCYFKPGSLQPVHMFEYLGMLLALAMYNGIAIPVSFPLAFYKRLLGQDCFDCADISDHWSVESRSLTQVLTENVDQMALDYSFSFDANGVVVTMSKPQTLDSGDGPMPQIYALAANATAQDKQPSAMDEGSETLNLKTLDSETLRWPGMHIPIGSPDHVISVTESNKAEYVRDYVRCLTYLAIKPQVDALKRGFDQVLVPYHISFATPHALQSIMEGTTSIDVSELRKHTAYDGYSDDDPYIEQFWTLLSTWPDEQLKALIRFVTAAERYPVTGASALTFKIQKVGTDHEAPRLPSSSTCFGTLFLPKYDSVATLEKMLNTAVELGEYGFGIS